MKKYEFIGIPSGDGENFCWDVDFETFKKYSDQKDIPKELLSSIFNENTYSLYPSDLYDLNNNKNEEIEINIKIKPIKNSEKQIIIITHRKI
ncbi:MAG: hypothetical protein ACOC2W_02250 [bacterium]